jgi:hypothetical protein
MGIGTIQPEPYGSLPPQERYKQANLRRALWAAARDIGTPGHHKKQSRCIWQIAPGNATKS